MSINKRKRTSDCQEILEELKLFITEKFLEQKQQLDAIEEKLKSVKTKLGLLTEVTPSRVKEQRPARANAFLAPRRSHKLANDRTIISEFIKGQLTDLNDSEIQNIMKFLSEVALGACNEFEADHVSEATKPWGSLTSQHQMEMCSRMFRKVTSENHSLSFIGDCVHLWPCKWLIQSKWTNKTKYNRSKR